MKNNYLITAVLVIVFAGAGFYGGMKYQESKAKAFTGQFGGGQGIMRNNRGGTGVNNRGGFKPVTGEIIS
ncbi:MAG: hypothetical protein Q7U68_02885, partial [Candidatus Roizmanbacteria bacterium]|nr:hypothetical protein [Candidatus Roizmanbacteria bacterium]